MDEARVSIERQNEFGVHGRPLALVRLVAVGARRAGAAAHCLVLRIPRLARGAGGVHLGPPQIARRFGLTAAHGPSGRTGVLAIALCALLQAVTPQPAHAVIHRRNANEEYSGAGYTIFQGVDVGAPDLTGWGGNITIPYSIGGTGFSAYLLGSGFAANEIEITAAHGVHAYLGDGGFNSFPSTPDSFTLFAFLTPDDLSIDWSQGWQLTMKFDCNPSDCDHVIFSEYSGPDVGGVTNFGSTIDEQFTYNTSSLLGYAQSNATGAIWSPTGSWVDPITVPKPSTWAMLLVGFFGMAAWALRRSPLAFARAPIFHSPFGRGTGGGGRRS